MEFNFNHKEDTLAKAIGAQPGDLDEFSDKFSEFCNMVNKTKSKKTSETVEKVLTTFSYSDLVIATALYAEKCIKEAKKNKKRQK